MTPGGRWRRRTRERTITHGGSINSLIAFAGLACAFAAGCGDDAPRDAAAAKPQPAKVDVERFLMQDGEEPGFESADRP